MILDEIVAHKREEVASGLANNDRRQLLHAAESSPPPRDFTKAIRRDDEVAVIAEIKRASPSAGVLCPALDVARRAQSYEAAGAAAVSIVTDSRFFQGESEWVRRVKDAVDLPVLRKDFIIDPLQVLESRALGADAVLLIAAALTGDQLAELLGLTRELRMAALVEVHDEDELRSALSHDAAVVGINNRDLRTFRVDLRVTEQLVRLIHSGVTVVSESGVQTAEDVRGLGADGVDAVLVGTSLMREEDPGPLLRTLVGVHKGARSS